MARRTHNLINNDDGDPQKALQKIRREMGKPEKKLEFSEQPQPITVYGDIGTDIDLQKDELVEVVAKMHPRVVVMGGGRKSDDGD